MLDGFIPKGSEFQVNTETDGDQISPSITALKDGGYVVTWTSGDAQDGDGYGIYAQRYDVNGVAVGAELQVNTITESQQRNPSITGLSDGGFVVTWNSFAQDGDIEGIYGQRYDATGATFGDEFLVNSYTINSQENSSITALADGGFVVTWESWGAQDGADQGIFAQRFDANGVPAGVEFQVNTFTASKQLGPSITALSDGGFVITWHSAFQDGDFFGVFAQRYDAAGANVGEEFQVNSNIVESQLDSSITTLADGGFLVAWETRIVSGNGSNIFAQRFDSYSRPIGDEFQVNTNSVSQQAPAITALPDGGFVVTWQSHTQDGDGSGIYGQRYDADGELVGGEFQINTETTNWQYAPSVTALENGGFVVTWQSEEQDGDGEGIYAQQFAAQLFGTAGDNTVIDEVGANWIDGQDGRDILRGLGGDDIIFGGEEDDILYGGKGNDELNGEENDDTLYGAKGDDVLNGGDGYDELIGGSGRDTLNGGARADTLTGGKGVDTLDGGIGNDVLKGGKGADIIEGGVGDDTLYGGKGADVFVFAADDGSDTIFDFKDGSDKLDLSGFDFADKAEALSHFYEKGSAKNDIVGFEFDGTKIRIEGLDLGDINNADIII